MPEYRIYTLSAGNRIAGPPRLIDCDNDQAAIKEAKQLINGKYLEVWQGARCVTRLRPADKLVTAEVIPFPKPDIADFDPDTVNILSEAFESAWSKIKASNSRFARAGYANMARELVAKRIIEIARKGERGPARLTDNAVDFFLASYQDEEHRPPDFMPQTV
jgi:hypothetical protein